MKNFIRYIHFGDRKLFNLINDKIKCSILDKIMPKITFLGGALVVSLVPLLMIFFGNDNINLVGKEILLSLIVSHLFVQILKRTIGRERPFNIMDTINTFKTDLKDYSFPSGHTTAIFSIITSLSINIPQLKGILLFIAIAIGISRIYVGVHYPSDVLIGSILGTYTSVLLHPYFIRMFI